MKSLNLILSTAAVCLSVGLRNAPAQDAEMLKAPTTEPTTAPAPKLGVSPEAKIVVDELGKAYTGLKSLDLAGSVLIDIDVAGKQEKHEDKFTSSYEAPNKFKHDANGEMLLGSTGEKTYAYKKSDNVYLSNDAPKQPGPARKMPAPIPQILMMQNPALILALSNDAAKELSDNTAIEKLPDTKLGEKSYQTLQVASAEEGAGVMTFLIDPSTHFVRQVKFDLSSSLVKRGAPDVKTAVVTVDYTTTTPGAAVKEGQFAWTPPEGAKDAKAARAEQQEKSPASALVGKPAPDFKLSGLDGKDVSLADLKGSVVIVDFWATWCGPCVQSLPHLNKVYDESKAAGLKVFAVDLREEKEKVQPFVEQHKLTIPVLLDAEGKTANSYQVESIPQTVLIGKDGIVRKVFIGFSDESEGELRQEVAEAMKAK